MKVLTLNTSALSFFFGLIDAKDDIEVRAKQIADKINEHKQEFDIVCLQEMFDKNAREIMKKNLKTNFPYFFEDTRYGRFIVGVNSGLMIFSKYEITRTIISDFNDKTGDSFFAKKGVMGVEISLPPSDLNNDSNIKSDLNIESKNEKLPSKMCIFTTHMQAGGNTKWYLKPLNLLTSLNPNQIRLSQLKEAQIIMNGFSQGLSFIYVGDFNINAFDATSVIDPNNKVKTKANEMIELIFPDSSTFDDENGIIYSTYDKKRIDYMLKFGVDMKSEIIEIFDEKDTDHRGVVGTF